MAPELNGKLAHTLCWHGDDVLGAVLGAAGGEFVELLVFVAGEEEVVAAAEPAVRGVPECAGALGWGAGGGTGHVVVEDGHGFGAAEAVVKRDDGERIDLTTDGAGRVEAVVKFFFFGLVLGGFLFGGLLLVGLGLGLRGGFSDGCQRWFGELVGGGAAGEDQACGGEGDEGESV